MKRIFFILFAVSILALGLGVYYRFFGDKAAFSIDYPHFETLAEKHPRGSAILEHIREQEKLLHDNNKDNDMSAYLAIGFEMRQLGDDNAAILAYLEALKIDKNNLLGLNNIATSYKDIGDFEKAEKAYRRLVAAGPGDVTAYKNLADTYLYLHPGDEEGLLEIIEQGIAEALDPAELISYLAVFYRDAGNTGKAIEYFEKFLKLVPSSAPARAELERLRN